MAADDEYFEKVALGARIELVQCLSEERLPSQTVRRNMWAVHTMCRVDSPVQTVSRIASPRLKKSLSSMWLLYAAVLHQFWEEEVRNTLRLAYELGVSPNEILPESLRSSTKQQLSKLDSDAQYQVQLLRERAEFIWADLYGPLERSATCRGINGNATSKQGLDEPEVELIKNCHVSYTLLRKLTESIDNKFPNLSDQTLHHENFLVSRKLFRGAPGNAKFLRPVLREYLGQGETFLSSTPAKWKTLSDTNGPSTYQGFLIATSLGIRFVYNVEPHDVLWDVPESFLVSRQERPHLKSVNFGGTLSSGYFMITTRGLNLKWKPENPTPSNGDIDFIIESALGRPSSEIRSFEKYAWNKDYR